MGMEFEMTRELEFSSTDQPKRRSHRVSPLPGGNGREAWRLINLGLDRKRIFGQADTHLDFDRFDFDLPGRGFKLYGFLYN